MQAPFNLQVVTGSTEVLISSSNARIVKIIPMGTPTGTVTLREANAIGGGSASRWTNPANTIADFGMLGVAFPGGLTVQLSVAGDSYGIVWGPKL